VTAGVLLLQVFPGHSELVRARKSPCVDRFLVKFHGIRAGRPNGFIEGDVELASGWAELSSLMKQENAFGRRRFDLLGASLQGRNRQAREDAQHDASGFQMKPRQRMDDVDE
jgi:hypothetical protein